MANEARRCRYVAMSKKESLTKEELVRYERHLKLNEFGIEKQLILKSSKVLIIGAGGLGSPIGMYLAAAGVGTIGVIDFDNVSLGNLQRQVAHSVDRIGKLKVHSLIQTMSGINPLLKYYAYTDPLSEENVLEIIEPYEMIIDGSDNFSTRFLVADACFLKKRVLVHGSTHQFEAQLSVFVPGEGPCYRCLYKSPPPSELIPNCNEAGVLGVLPGTVGLIMATEAIKFLTKIGETINGKLVVYNALKQTIKRLNIVRNNGCPLCGVDPSITSIKSSNISCKMSSVVSAKMSEKMINEGAFLLDVREPYEYEFCHIEGSKLIPLPNIDEERVKELPLDREIIVYCHKGARSLIAVNLIKRLGFEKVFSLDGGIESWSRNIDRSIPLY